MNPILDTRMYQVEFAGGEVTVLITNVIAELMYTQCDTNMKEYSHLDVLVDYHNYNKVISLTDQQTTVQGRSVTCKTTAGWQIC